MREHPPVTADLDVVLAWCLEPKPDTLDRIMVMLAWHTLIDFAVAEPFPDAIESHEPGYALSIVVDKVHDDSPATTDSPRALASAKWSAAELLLLARTLRDAIGGFGDEIIMPGA